MWPFRKKRNSPVLAAKLPYETICPACLERFGPGQIAPDYPFCSDCSSEGMDIEVEAFDSFMASKSCADFAAMQSRLQEAGGLLPAFKNLKASRVRSLTKYKGC